MSPSFLLTPSLDASPPPFFAKSEVLASAHPQPSSSSPKKNVRHSFFVFSTSRRTSTLPPARLHKPLAVGFFELALFSLPSTSFSFFLLSFPSHHDAQRRSRRWSQSCQDGKSTSAILSSRPNQQRHLRVGEESSRFRSSPQTSGFHEHRPHHHPSSSG